MLQPVELLCADPSGAITGVTDILYHGFNFAPQGAGGIRVIEEDNKEWGFLHAPASHTFAPAPGNCRVSATLAFQSAALNDADCLAALPVFGSIDVPASDARQRDDVSADGFE